MNGRNVAQATGCQACGGELDSAAQPETRACWYCGRSGTTAVACRNGHYLCDSCHSLPANDLIERHCTVTEEPDPLAMALTLMRNPSLKMHGPEHHFLVAAVLITAWSIERANRDRVPLLLATARARAEDTRGDYCGKHGACGAAMGAGIAYSVITGAKPLSAQDWRLVNLMTATCLTSVAESGGPRCCKRDTFLSIMTAVGFLNEHAGTALPVSGAPACEFSNLNRECPTTECSFYRGTQAPGEAAQA